MLQIDHQAILGTIIHTIDEVGHGSLYRFRQFSIFPLNHKGIDSLMNVIQYFLLYNNTTDGHQKSFVEGTQESYATCGFWGLGKYLKIYTI